MATAAGSAEASVDLGAVLAEASVGVASLVVLGVAAALVEAVAAEVGLLVGSFRGKYWSYTLIALCKLEHVAVQPPNSEKHSAIDKEDRLLK